MSKVKVGIIGYGYWGPNLVRNFSIHPDTHVQVVCDLRIERLVQLQQAYPQISITSDVEDIFNNPEIDAVIIATPVFTHYPFAKRALEKGKHVLIEKPMTRTAEEAEDLINIAQSKNKVLMVDHTFLYTGAVQKVKQIVESGEIGNIRYFDSTRINLGLLQNDVNVLWDLAPHDISILTYLVPETPASVHAIGVSHTRNGLENIAYLTLMYESGIIAHFHCSWSSPVKIRTTLIGGDKKMMVYNDLEATEKIKVYDTGFAIKNDEDKRKILVDYRTGDIYSPKVELKEALYGMADDFARAILTGTEPVSSWKSGLITVQILEAAQKSISENGKEITLKAGEFVL